MNKVNQFSNLTQSEIEEQIIARRKSLFDLRIKKARGEQIKSSLFRLYKHEIAQLSFYESVEKKKEISK